MSEFSIFSDLSEGNPGGVVWLTPSAQAADPQGDAFGRGCDYAGEGKFEKALAQFWEALEIWPDFAEAYCNVGAMLVNLERFEDAIPALERAIELKPDLAAAYCNLGIAFLGRGKIESAIAAINEAIDLNPNFAEAYYHLGSIRAQEGQLDEAITSLRKAISLNPYYADAHDQLSFTYVQRGDLQLAIEACQTASDIRPTDSRLFVNLGSLHARAGDYEKARLAYRLARNFSSNEGEQQEIELLIRKIRKVISDKNKLADTIEQAYNVVNSIETIMDEAARAILQPAARRYGLSVEEADKALTREAEAKTAAREMTARAKAEPRPDWVETRKQGAHSKSELSQGDLKLSSSQVAAVLEDSTLGRLRQRYHDLLNTVVVPPTTVEEARMAGNLVTTYSRFRKRQEQVGVELEPENERIAEVEKARAAFYRAGKHRPGAGD